MAFGDNPIGVVGRNVVLLPLCAVVLCNGLLLDLESGERTPLPGEGWQFQSEALIDGADGPLLVTQISGETDAMGVQLEPPTFAAIDVESNVAGPRVGVALVSMFITSVPAWDMGVEVPPGWFVATGSDAPVPVGQNVAAGMTLYAVSATTGELIPLIHLGPGGPG